MLVRLAICKSKREILLVVPILSVRLSKLASKEGIQILERAIIMISDVCRIDGNGL